MKYNAVLIMMFIFVAGCTSSQISGNAQLNIPPNENIKIVKLEVKEMFCPSCALGVEYELKQVQGVYSAEIKYPEGTGTVIYDSSQISAEEIAAASTVYPASVVEDSVFNG